MTLALVATAYLWFAIAVRGARGFSGDEPHYLAFSQSMWLYHTIDQHNVLYNHDFLSYFPVGMSSHSVHRGNHLYPLHYLGLPLALLPGFALGGAAGAQITLIAIAMLLLWRVTCLARRLAGPVAAAATIGVMGLSAPFVLNAGAIYPDLLSGLLIVLAYEALDAPQLTSGRALALGALLAFCPWVHVKLLVVVALCLAWAAYSLWRQRRPHSGWRRLSTPALLAFGLPLASVAALMVYNQVFYGSPSPAAPYNGPTLFTGNVLEGMIGQLFAQGQGMLGTAPFLLLVVPGAVALWRRDRATALKIIYLTVPFWLVTLTYRDWWGGDAAPLRYLLPLVPLWSLGIAALLGAARTIATRLTCAALAIITLALSAVIPVAPRLGWPLASGQSPLLQALAQRVGLPLTAWLPTFEPTREGPGLWHGTFLVGVWGVLLLAAWALLARREGALGARRTRTQRGRED